jgi:hypothetical protein
MCMKHQSIRNQLSVQCFVDEEANCTTMASIMHLTTLANTITENIKIITDYLTTRNLSAPSFDIDGLAELQISPVDREAWAARSKVVAATKELHDLTIGPKESLRNLAWDVCFVFLCR